MRELRDRIRAEVANVVVGQEDVLDLLLIGLMVRGHVLLEGPPGTAKTLLANTTARALGLHFRRAQFTPDMLPSDLTGTMALKGGQLGELAFRPGPVFTNILLADEINRTPPKTQSALLEAMGESQVSVDGTSHRLPDPFLVVATQNPIEYEGTYPLPEAQLDRFTVKGVLSYPSAEQETAMLRLGHSGVVASRLNSVRAVATAGDVAAARAQVDAVAADDIVLGYVTAIVRATRVLPSVLLGASPRAAVHLLAVARAVACLAGRTFVTPDDVRDSALPVLRHRIVLRPEAELERFRADEAITAALASVPVPR